MDKPSCICHAMKRLLKEQQIIAGIDMEFQFICSAKKVDTIPFMLNATNKNKPFRAFYNCIATPFFRLEKMDEDTCCAQLSLLEAVDIEGNPTDSCDDLFTLRKTKSCIIVNLNCFCAITPLPLECVNRPLPIIEPKC
ncbi:CotY/CotZ family spore coat protein [Sporosarcina sp. NPDC096371]|uniref:CotY/CotZ family spore coat protein n=1 Tax=Sporosarcina sp. NPDC096371 TaxID=3364530 RepID=UPI0037FFBB59